MGLTITITTITTTTIITITTATIYFIHPSGKSKPSFDRTTKNISIILSHETHAHTHS